MNLSLGEVEATAKKAARGAGYPWGLAEDAATATRWLCAQGLDGCAALAALLSTTDGADLARHTPQPGAEPWRAPGGTLCPLIAGAALSDHAAALASAPRHLAQIAQPILLLPFAAQAARALAQPVRITWPDGHATTDGTQLHLTAEPGPTAAHVTASCEGTGPPPRPACDRATPAPAAWDTLLALAHRTYAPATDESRRKGAGDAPPDPQ